jgi:hypothetical protein
MDHRIGSDEIAATGLTTDEVTLRSFTQILRVRRQRGAI